MIKHRDKGRSAHAHRMKKTTNTRANSDTRTSSSDNASGDRKRYLKNLENSQPTQKARIETQQQKSGYDFYTDQSIASGNTSSISTRSTRSDRFNVHMAESQSDTTSIATRCESSQSGISYSSSASNEDCSFTIMGVKYHMVSNRPPSSIEFAKHAHSSTEARPDSALTDCSQSTTQNWSSLEQRSASSLSGSIEEKTSASPELSKQTPPAPTQHKTPKFMISANSAFSVVTPNRVIQQCEIKKASCNSNSDQHIHDAKADTSLIPTRKAIGKNIPEKVADIGYGFFEIDDVDPNSEMDDLERDLIGLFETDLSLSRN